MLSSKIGLAGYMVHTDPGLQQAAMDCLRRIMRGLSRIRNRRLMWLLLSHILCLF
jgi:hypothetical protein